MWWSYSTHRTMRLCQRKLVYEQKIASGTTNDPDRKDAFLLRQIQTLSEWQGSLVHQTLESSLVSRLRDRLPVSTDELVRFAVALAARQWKFSAKRRYRELGMVKTAQGEDYCALDVHEANAPLITQSEALDNVEAFVQVCFQNLMAQSELMAWLRSASGFVAEHQVTFPLGSATVRATPDLVCRLSSNRLLLIDWKTVASETDDYATQLYLYALTMVRSGRWLESEAERIILCEANLFQGVIRQYQITEANLATAEDFAYTSILEMTTLLANISKRDFQIEDYEITEKATTCATCAFQTRCRAEQKRETASSFPIIEEMKVVRQSKKTTCCQTATSVFAVPFTEGEK